IVFNAAIANTVAIGRKPRYDHNTAKFIAASACGSWVEIPSSTCFWFAFFRDKKFLSRLGSYGYW
ncbi:MAG: hypothetical protein ACOVQM_08850, partial [Pirellula sp.]